MAQRDGGLPRYDFSPWFVARWLAGVVLLRRKRDLGRDGRALFAGRRPRPRVEGIERAPREGACIVVMNHYERPGLRVWWCAALVTAALEARRGGDPPVRWLITDRFEGFRSGGVRLPDALMAWLLRTIARAYGLLLVARPESEAGSRSALLREARRVLREGAPLALTPEAASGSGVELARPWPGSGAALAWLARGSVPPAPLVPVAVFDGAEGRLVARFGAPFTLERASDEDASEVVMRAIAALLPAELRGPYGRGAADVP